MNVDSYQVLLNYSFRLLTRKNYSEAEMRTRLDRKGKKVLLSDLESAIPKVIARLKEFNYINDDKILENFFEYRLRSKPQGRFLFLGEMRRRGIAKEKAAAEWDKKQVDEQELAKDLIKKKERQFRGLDKYARKKKIATFLASRGFGADTIWGLMDSND